MSIIAQGAEAVIRHEKGSITKDRVKKSYRHPQLDAELRKSRSRREKKVLEKAGKIIAVPKVQEGNDTQIIMEFIDGPALKIVLEDNINYAKSAGEMLAKLHNAHIIHGDLTTSNIMVRANALVFIDFGLAYTSHKVEDKAVDLHLFRQALESKHHRVFSKAYRVFLQGYKKAGDKAVIDRLKVVEARGRHKAKI